MLLRQLGAERLEVRGHQQGRRQHQADAEGEERQRENPAHPAEHALQQSIGIENGQLDVEDVGQRLHPFAAPAFVALLVQLFAGARRLVLRQAGVDELLRERLDILQFQTIGAIANLVLFLGVLQGVLAVEILQEEVFVVLETIVAQADGIFDDVKGASLVLLRLDGEVAAQTDADLLASFEIIGGSGGFHGSEFPVLSSLKRKRRRLSFAFASGSDQNAFIRQSFTFAAAAQPWSPACRG